MSKFLTYIFLVSQILIGCSLAAESTDESLRVSSDDYSINLGNSQIQQPDTDYEESIGSTGEESGTEIQCCEGWNYTPKEIQSYKEMSYKALTLLSFIPAAVLPLCTHLSQDIAFGYAIWTSVILTNLNASQLFLPIDPNKPIVPKLSSFCAISVMTGLTILAWVEWQSDFSSNPKPQGLTYCFALIYMAVAGLWMKGTTY